VKTLALLLLLAPAAMAQSFVVRIVEFELVPGAQLVTRAQALPGDFNAMMNAIAVRGVSIREIHRVGLAPGQASGADDDMRVTLESVMGSEARVKLHVTEPDRDVELSVPLNGSAMVEGEPVAVSVFDASMAERVSEVYFVRDGIVAPRTVFSVQPVYSEKARRDRISGIVILQAIIDRDGSVSGVHVLKGLSDDLDQSASDAVRQWRFAPATKDGQPVSVIFNMTVQFRLR
jgi:TonB family protein